MTPGPAPHRVRLDALLAACLVSLTAGLAAELAWRSFSVRGMGVPATLACFETLSLVLAAAVPVVGNGLGYFMVHRHRSRRALLPFVGPSACLAGVGLAVALSQLPDSPGFREVAATTVAALITPTLTVAVLTTRRNLLRLGTAPATPLVT